MISLSRISFENQMFRNILVFFLLIVFSSDALAQGRRNRGRPERPATEGQSDSADKPAPFDPGTVPDLATPADQIVPLTVVNPLLTDSIAPPDIPLKVVRYASRILEKYDLNQSGFLEREEWSQMPGSPQSIDTDGDFIISLDELIRFIALYGDVRTIHRPNPPPIPARLTWDASAASDFHPFSAPLKPKKVPEEPKPEEPEGDAAKEIDENQIVGETAPETEAEKAAVSDESPPEESPSDEEPGETSEEKGKEEDLDALSYEKVFAGQFQPRERKYFVPLNELKGVPNWFVLRDKNGDGQLSMVEFDPTLSPAGLATFGRLDKNGDGFLTPDEVRVEQK